MRAVWLLPCVAVAFQPSAYPNGVYDPVSARSHFRRRPFEVAGRALEICQRSAGFAGALLLDRLAGREIEGAHAAARSRALTGLLAELGPTFIKLGQSASVRSDLLPETYVRALAALQEDVPPFASAEAREIIAAELGDAEYAKLDGLSAEPIAAASLGQVYRATREGAPVAVKVQRPRVTEAIALDMHLVRDYAMPIASRLGVPGDLVGTADAWGAGLVAELDYALEAENAARFNADVARGALAGSVFAPRVVAAASARRVLTTEWVEGERLDRTDAPDDVPRLCSLAMNCYMDMMLRSGTLHCDPHPGNLLRTRDGRLCILDWGLVTTLDPDLQLTLIEHVAHLTAEDYARIPGDLVRLGFVPAGSEAAALEAGVVSLLTRAYRERAAGGGFARFDVPGLFQELRALAADTPSGLFQIPPYFAYIAKCFSVLEGIGLSVDPDYSIVNETLPYVSRRIVTDPSPRTAGALRTFVFGDAREDARRRVIDADRVGSLVDGVRRYSSSVDGGGAAGVDAERVADAVLDLLAQDTPAATLATEQLALVLAAASRQLLADARARSGTAPSTGAAPSDRSALGAALDPIGLFRGSALVNTDERDRAALRAAAKLASIVNGDDGAAGAPTEAEQRRLAGALATKAWERRDDVRRVSRRLARELLQQTASRMTTT